ASHRAVLQRTHWVAEPRRIVRGTVRCAAMLLWIALGLLAVVVVLAFTTRGGAAVDPLARQRAAAPAKPSRGGLWKLMHSGDAVERAALLVRQGNKIEAIQVLRDATGVELTEAKQAVDEIERSLASGGPRGERLGGRAKQEERGRRRA